MEDRTSVKVCPYTNKLLNTMYIDIVALMFWLMAWINTSTCNVGTAQFYVVRFGGQWYVCLRVLFTYTPADLLGPTRRDALTLVWPYYVDTLSLPGTPDHVLQVLHSQLRSLPWGNFYPDAQAMALMLQVSPTQCVSNSKRGGRSWLVDWIRFNIDCAEEKELSHYG